MYNMDLKSFEGGSKAKAQALKDKCAHWAPYASVGSKYMWQLCSTKTID